MVVADTVYGMTRGLRGWLEERERSYVLAITSSKSGLRRGPPRRSARQPEASTGILVRASAGKGTKASVSTIGLS